MVASSCLSARILLKDVPLPSLANAARRGVDCSKQEQQGRGCHKKNGTINSVAARLHQGDAAVDVNASSHAAKTS
jgi:hypothetical protein